MADADQTPAGGRKEPRQRCGGKAKVPKGSKKKKNRETRPARAPRAKGTSPGRHRTRRIVSPVTPGHRRPHGGRPSPHTTRSLMGSSLTTRRRRRCLRKGLTMLPVTCPPPPPSSFTPLRSPRLPASRSPPPIRTPSRPSLRTARAVRWVRSPLFAPAKMTRDGFCFRSNFQQHHPGLEPR